MAKIRVDRRKIDLGEPIKKVGRYAVPVELFTDVTVEVATLVVPEGGELDEARPRRQTSGGRSDAGEPGAEALRDRAVTPLSGPSAQPSAAQSNDSVNSLCGGLGKCRTKRPLRAAFSSTAPSDRDGNIRSDPPANGRILVCGERLVQALFDRVRRWLICRACTNLPRLRRPPRSHRRISMQRSRSSAR